ncbi:MULTISPECIES: hypothetical protein [Sphingomonadaceae]|jgi:hypothetical protein|uniref:Uncharacterized protein n=6 Tax=Sphingomonadaceae TaxID=41297 RepID=A0A437J4K9_9SPHN|nr:MULTISPECIES: hypothetical protein [Sphingomonadaceae]KAA9011032.1 hypothetical protein F4U96_23890 [Sphingobium limneticum]KAA9023217.1 hypothetical protein F4U95_23755 [Sphingobium limneticum]KEZ14664.1 hypothetical protein CP98_04760 [Sphingobium yanoikuyae]MDG2514982.1 hypothetical protein [Sphingobium yanoikuyae]NBB38818.1 hypothetical protein [Sphingobium yanoikuyae]
MKMHPPIQPPLPEIPLVDNMFAPEILAGGLTGLSLLNGIVTVTLENPRADHGRPDPSLERVIVGRIGMPIPTAQALLCGLYQFLSQHQVNPLAAETEMRCQ